MNPQQEVKAISKFMSLVLRHRPQTAGLELDQQGWTSVEALLSGMDRAGRSVTRQQLEEVVRTNDKQRFEFSADGTRIRASQGHSVQVDLAYETATPPDVLYHGTAARSLESIRTQGLRKRNRHHVHLSTSPASARSVGARHGSPVVLTVDAKAMVAGGHVFHVSTNGVWLTDHVPPAYLRET